MPTTINGPVELLHAIPALIGQDPTDCLVVVGIRDDGIVALVMRVLIADTGTRDVLLRATQPAFARQDVAALTYVAYGGQPPDVDELVAVTSASFDVADVIHVTDGPDGRRWRSLMCQDERCCPPEGRRLDV